MSADKPPVRESIWSVARRLRPLFSIILIVQFLAFLAINAFKAATRENPGDALDIITKAYEDTSSQAFSILLMAYTLTEVIMLASWLRERDQQREQEAEERGRQETDQEWRDWFERYQLAQQEGREFNEPPPQRPGKGNGA